MKTVSFIFGIHNHQPVGNFDFVIEDAYQKSYLPFLEIVEEFPEMHISFHFSGCLLEWLEAHHPVYLDRVAMLVARGNVEILSGGFFEPVLAMIPDDDKIGQIRMLNDYIRDRFNYEPQGLWLTERVWEPYLAKPIAAAGIRYITVDDFHFLSTGKTEKDLTGHFITEEQGHTLSIFPISQKLRYAIPFKDPRETISYLGQFATEDGQNAVVMADDGEKFGVWPGTHETVFKKDWLREFFRTLQQNQEWIKTCTFAEYYREHAPKGRIYLPTASYFEMGEWALPWETGEIFNDFVHELEADKLLDRVRPFIKGGIWRNFLFKYDESNWMQKKALWLSGRLATLSNQKLNPEKTEQLQAARLHLWRSTCNCAYWHGIFGGLYLPHLRHAIYSEQLKCEILLDQLENRRGFQASSIDFDGDGEPEILASNQALHLVFIPHRGASISELSLMDRQFNLLNGIRRYKEAYHRKVFQAGKEPTSGSIHDMVLAKEEGLADYLRYDHYPRKCLIDHIIHPSVSPEQFRNGDYYEDSDFISGNYAHEIDHAAQTIRFSRDGWINWQRFRILKTICFQETGLLIRYQLTNIGDHTNIFRFGPEFNFALLGGNSPDRYYIIDGQKATGAALITADIINPATRVGVVNEWDRFQVEIVSSQPTAFWRFPIETVSLSEAGFERVYQSSVVIPWYDIHLQPGETQEITLSLVVTLL